jgi:ketosteroid isomerase-like protein
MSIKSAVHTDPLAESHQRFIDAFIAADVPTLVSLYTETAVLMPPNDPSLLGRAELEEWHREYFADFRVVSFGEIERDVTLLDGWAVERWAYLLSIQPLQEGAERIRDEGRFLAVWQQRNGVWQIAQAMLNSTRPVGAGTSRFLARLKKETGQK